MDIKSSTQDQVYDGDTICSSDPEAEFCVQITASVQSKCRGGKKGLLNVCSSDHVGQFWGGGTWESPHTQFDRRGHNINCLTHIS